MFIINLSVITEPVVKDKEPLLLVSAMYMNDIIGCYCKNVNQLLT